MDRAPSRVLPPPTRRTPSRDGFTLVELLVTIAIIGVAAALSIPRIADITAQNRVLRASQALQIEVQQAFAIAGRNRAPVTVQWNSSTVELQVKNRAGSTVYRRASLKGYGLSAADVTIAPTALTVFPNGIAGDSLVIRVSKAGHTKSILVSRAGMIRLR